MIKYQKTTPDQVQKFLKKIADRTKSNSKKRAGFIEKEHKSNL
jgi:hypothetical protein